MNFQLLLLFILGVSVKIYDDLNDNNLFEFFNISKEKNYINHFLIGFHYICWTMSALKLPLCNILIYIFYLYTYFIDNKALSQPYEFNGFLLMSLLSLYLLFFENLIGKILDECKKIYLYLSLCEKYIYILYIIILYIIIFFITIVYITYIEFVILINTEFSYKKLISRFLLIIFLIVVFIINHLYFPNIFNYFILYFIGYCLTSCIFQIILIRKDRIEKSLKKEKKSLKKAKKEKKLLKIQQINTS